MENENKELEADSQNVSEETEETPKKEVSEDTSTEDQTSQKGDAKYSENEKQLYERAKKAEAKAKRLEHLEKKVEEENKSSETPNTPVEEVAKTVHALKDYSAEEVETIFRQAKVLNVSPLEAIKNEDVALLIEAKRAKVAQESKTPEPTNRQDTEEKDFSQWSGQDIEKASMENLSKYYDFLKKKK